LVSGTQFSYNLNENVNKLIKLSKISFWYIFVSLNSVELRLNIK